MSSMLEQTIDRLSTRDVCNTSNTNILLELTEVAFNKLLYEDFEVSIEQIVVRSE